MSWNAASVLPAGKNAGNLWETLELLPHQPDIIWVLKTKHVKEYEFHAASPQLGSADADATFCHGTGLFVRRASVARGSLHSAAVGPRWTRCILGVASGSHSGLLPTDADDEAAPGWAVPGHDPCPNRRPSAQPARRAGGDRAAAARSHGRPQRHPCKGHPWSVHKQHEGVHRASIHGREERAARDDGGGGADRRVVRSAPGRAALLAFPAAAQQQDAGSCGSRAGAHGAHGRAGARGAHGHRWGLDVQGRRGKYLRATVRPRAAHCAAAPGQVAGHVPMC
eukprot:scaffold7029_cov66-Phaeocystis_antarctica.AAC.8